MAKLRSVATAVTVFHEGDNPVYGDTATIISIDDQAAGPFLRVRQTADHLGHGEVVFDADELEYIMKAAHYLMQGYEAATKQTERDSDN